MNYEEMFVQLVAFMFIFNLLIQFFILTMPLSAAMVLPPKYVGFDYNKNNLTADFNAFNKGSTPTAGSSIDTGNFTWQFGNMVEVANVGMKMIGRIFFGYSELGIAIADGIEPSSSGPIHGLLGGIGLLFSILCVFGLLLLLRSLVFKV